MAGAAGARQSRALLFTDLKSAFYSCLAEVPLGPILEGAARHGLLTKLGFDEAEVANFKDKFLDGAPSLEQLGLDTDWVAAIRD